MYSADFKVMKHLLKEMRSYSIDLPCRVKSTFTNVLHALFSMQKPQIVTATLNMKFLVKVEIVQSIVTQNRSRKILSVRILLLKPPFQNIL